MIISIILLMILIYINGVFSSCELAFLSLNKIKLKEDIDHCFDYEKTNIENSKVDEVILACNNIL